MRASAKLLGVFSVASVFLAARGIAQEADDCGAAPDGGVTVVAYRQLALADFKGTEPPNTPSTHLGRICAGIEIRGSDLELSEVPETAQFKATAKDATIQSFFVPEQSWIRAGSTDAGSTAARLTTLRHEQGHFDLLEVRARELRAKKAEILALVSLSAVGSTKDDARKKLDENIAGYVRTQREELKRSVESRYDDDVKKNPASQAVWDRWIAKWLREGKFALSDLDGGTPDAGAPGSEGGTPPSAPPDAGVPDGGR